MLSHLHVMLQGQLTALHRTWIVALTPVSPESHRPIGFDISALTSQVLESADTGNRTPLLFFLSSNTFGSLTAVLVKSTCGCLSVMVCMT